MFRAYEDGNLLTQHFSVVHSQDAKRAFHYLMGWASTLPDYECLPGRHGHIRDFRFMRGSDWDFAFIPNKAWLLFYFRAPSLRPPKFAKAEVLARFPAAKETSSGEITIRIESLDDAVELARFIDR
ncbi:hypothetical protein [Luteimonas sp. MHLX1A]|uniref:hypothetical protein n=1 Tax=Alterluteimonas muca TaxID=2878684 RepID=UPI001E618379|nr:hypothetical protein [Luteimonas sp. MHLX1A]MCD9046807.1 hypothetical protein [Luteimonas sp. MHLX1A]